MRITTIILSVLCLSFLLGACQKSTADVERSSSVIPLDLTIGVVPFSQPLNTSELITGYIPENQGHITSDALNELDLMLRTSLHTTGRTYSWLPAPLAINKTNFHASEIPQSLDKWIAYGQEYRVNFLLVPQVLNWHQRAGSRAGVTQSAHVRVEFFLLDIRHGRIFRRSVFEEKQLGLANDLSRVGDFLKRGGGWVKAEELTQEGIAKAIDELGLQ